MEELNKIKQNRAVYKLNKYLGSLGFTAYGWLSLNDYYDEHGVPILCVYTDSKQIIIDTELRNKCMEDDLLFYAIKKFTKCEDYSIKWKNLIK